ncbi:hypothetical protein ACFSHT_22450 [Paraburkholderia silviterrae]|uniref:Uncharacterized protein n=1 Tax=Paraburkholderia silviterrae TaxID=2528715 RepID=A0A4R5MF36_9BURK|nr:hypothetical protein [Paraburkholderia silviterrae]TDG25858.1 hypothetical protein EYW47_00360 [Paraburkholderia silviterrae]
MKKQSPMQMRKEAAKPKAEKKAEKPKTAMDRYAKDRASKPAPAAVMVGEMHDPHMDVHTLSRADEIKRNPTRHRAAKQAAKAQIKKLSGIAQ